MNCWLVVWSRKKLQLNEFLEAVKNKKTDISVWVHDALKNDIKEGDFGVVVIMEGPSKKAEPRGVCATFTVTHAPRMMTDTHPQFWVGDDKDEEKMRARVRLDPFFDLLTTIASDPNLKMRANNPHRDWVRSIPLRTYDMVRGHVKSREAAIE